MARVTIEDCRKYVPNRFELVILAAQRAKDLALGMPALIQKGRDKDAVLALREIAAGAIDCEKLKQLLISKQLDPMTKGFKSINQTLELENIFKDLAASATEVPADGYEQEELEELDSSKEEEESSLDYDLEDEDLDEENPIANQEQEFDVDVSFDDEEVED